MSTLNRQFLGVGWKFPLQVTPNGKVAMAGYEQRIEESIYLILSTAKGERIMLPDFGCGIHDLVFEPNSSLTRNMVVSEARKALVKYEPRIDVISVQVKSTSEQPNLLLIRIDYRIRSTNAMTNMVFPFFLKEGM